MSKVFCQASIMISFNLAFTSSSSQYLSSLFCSHSKYETVTPPALARTSGMTSIFLANNILSASGVVGPLPISKITLALMLLAFSALIWFSRAAGTKTSTGRAKNSVREISFTPGKSVSACLFSLRAKISSIFKPSSL